MNAFASLVTSGDVLFAVEAPNARALFQSIADTLGPGHGLAPSAVADGLWARENLGSTGLGEGVAIPHARLKGLGQAVAAVARSRVALPFDSPDGKPVSHFFVLLVPEEATEQHLQILADAVRMLADADFRIRLGDCGTAQAVVDLLASWRTGACGDPA